jgi:hypothetical protein
MRPREEWQREALLDRGEARRPEGNGPVQRKQVARLTHESVKRSHPQGGGVRPQSGRSRGKPRRRTHHDCAPVGYLNETANLYPSMWGTIEGF